MFRPELKNTGWEAIEELVFEITGDKYEESHLFDYSTQENQLATIINNSLMNMLWDRVTVTELEDCFSEEIKASEFDIVNFRLSMEVDGSWPNTTAFNDCVYGWVHYKEDKKINTFRFQIGLDGSFNKC